MQAHIDRATDHSTARARADREADHVHGQNLFRDLGGAREARRKEHGDRPPRTALALPVPVGGREDGEVP